MQITAALAHYLKILAGDPDVGDRLAADLNQLAREVTVAVPSCLSVSIGLLRQGSEITIGTMAQGGDSDPVLASLAIPLSAAHPSNTLILRAAVAGAFLLLGDDLASQLGPGHQPIEVDKHRSAPAIPGRRIVDSRTRRLWRDQPSNRSSHRPRHGTRSRGAPPATPSRHREHNHRHDQPGAAALAVTQPAEIDRSASVRFGVSAGRDVVAATRQLAELRHQLLDPPTPIRRPEPGTKITGAETVGAVA